MLKEPIPLGKGRIFNQKPKIGQKAQLGPMSRNPIKLIKSDNPFIYEFNHTSFTQI